MHAQWDGADPTAIKEPDIKQPEAFENAPSYMGSRPAAFINRLVAGIDG